MAHDLVLVTEVRHHVDGQLEDADGGDLRRSQEHQARAETHLPQVPRPVLGGYVAPKLARRTHDCPQSAPEPAEGEPPPVGTRVADERRHEDDVVEARHERRRSDKGPAHLAVPSQEGPQRERDRVQRRVLLAREHQDDAEDEQARPPYDGGIDA